MICSYNPAILSSLFDFISSNVQKYKKESSYIIFSPIFFGLFIIFGRHIKLLPFQGARRADMNTQGDALG